MVRSNLKYCVSVWAPHIEKSKAKIEQVHRRADGYVTNNYCYTSNVTVIICHLQWPTLEHKRNISRITMLCKISHHFVAIDQKMYLVKLTFLL